LIDKCARIPASDDSRYKSESSRLGHDEGFFSKLLDEDVSIDALTAEIKKCACFELRNGWLRHFRSARAFLRMTRSHWKLVTQDDNFSTSTVCVAMHKSVFPIIGVLNRHSREYLSLAPGSGEHPYHPANA
jgi:hypothetical protein